MLLSMLPAEEEELELMLLWNWRDLLEADIVKMVDYHDNINNINNINSERVELALA